MKRYWTWLASLLPVALPAAEPIFYTGFERCDDGGCPWALEETFDGDPPAPSQDLLPRNFDYVVTHRTHPRDHLPEFSVFPADHGPDCAGPAPPNRPQHDVRTTHASNGTHPDPSFYVCKNHMMSSMGDVEGYSVTSFWPRQAFDFHDGGVLEFDVNINDGHARSWWEVLIAPGDQLKAGAASEWLPIDETYPRDRIVFVFSEQSSRRIMVGSRTLAPAGWTTEANDWRSWRDIDADDPALTDRRIRRTMRIRLTDERITWSVQKADGSFDEYAAELNEPLAFQRGYVLFKTHAYTPTKDENYDLYTYHWDNLRFSGPTVGLYDIRESDDFVYLQANGSRAIGEEASAFITLDSVPAAPRLFGQLNGAMRGQVLLSINGGEFSDVHPFEYGDGGCMTGGWSSFLLPLDASQLRAGENEFRWRIGPRPDCAVEWAWDGFSVKSLEVQFPQ